MLQCTKNLLNETFSREIFDFDTNSVSNGFSLRSRKYCLVSTLFFLPSNALHFPLNLGRVARNIIDVANSVFMKMTHDMYLDQEGRYPKSIKSNFLELIDSVAFCTVFPFLFTIKTVQYLAGTIIHPGIALR